MKRIWIVGIVALTFILGISVVSIQNNIIEGGETCYADGISNNTCGLIGKEYSDCWIKGGAVFMGDFSPLVTLTTYNTM
jgi:hypothetical protein